MNNNRYVGKGWMYQLAIPGAYELEYIIASSRDEALEIACVLVGTTPDKVKGLRRLAPGDNSHIDFRRQGFHMLRFKNSHLLPEYRAGANKARIRARTGASPGPIKRPS